MKIYFAGPIRSRLPSGKTDKAVASPAQHLIEILKAHGEVLSELAFDPDNDPLTLERDKRVFERDVAWIDESDVMVAEISTPSHGVGWEICYAQHVRKIPVLCLWRVSDGKIPSAMIRGNDYVKVAYYDLNPEETKSAIESFFLALSPPSQEDV